jgi:hypothetical protein
VIDLAVISTVSMRLANYIFCIFPLGQFTKLFGNPVRFGKRGRGITDSRPTELLSDCVNRSVYSPSAGLDHRLGSPPGTPLIER